MSRLYFSLFFTCVTLGAIAQENIYAPVYDAFQNAPKSPAAASLYKFQEFKPDLCTGTLNVSLDLFQITEGNLSVPISLRFNPAGVKVNDMPSTVGMGWSLSVGGSISQSVNGLDDIIGTEGDLTDIGSYLSPSYENIDQIRSTTISNMPQFYDFRENAVLTNNQYEMHEGQRFLGRVADGWLDGEADEFIYSVPGLSGSLFYDQADEKFLESRMNGVEVVYYPDSKPPNFSGWTLKDKNNIDYHFGAIGKYKTPLTYDHTQVPGMNPSIPGTIKYQTLNDNWQLTQIVDNNTNRTINFEYDKSWKDRTMGTFNQVTFGGLIPFSYRSSVNKTNRREGDEFTIKKIISESVIVDFVYDLTVLPNYDVPVLKTIIVRNKLNEIIREISFEYLSYSTIKNDGNFEGNNSIIFLNKVFETDILNPTNPKTLLYEFEYINPHQIPKRFIYAQDKFGYFNGIYNNVSLIPKDELIEQNCENPNTYGGDRSQNFQYVLNGMLKKVKYPTGGTSEFFFEQNIIGTTFLGGFRVQKINYKTEDNQIAMTKEYGYTSEDVKYIKPRFYYPSNYISFMLEENRVNFSGSTLLPLNLSNGSPVFYEEVTETSSSNLLSGYVKYIFNLPDQIPNDGGDLYISFPHPKIGNLKSFQNYLVKTIVYDGLDNIVQEVTNDFEPLNNLTHFIKNVQCGWSTSSLANHGFTIWAGNSPYSLIQYPGMNMYIQSNEYNNYSEMYLPVLSKEKTYSGMTFFEKQTETEYDQQTGNPLIKRKINSDNSITEERFTYSNNYTTYTNTDPWNVSLKETSTQLPIEYSVYSKGISDVNFKLTKSVLYRYNKNKVVEAYELKISSPISDFVESVNTSGSFNFDSRYEKKYEVLSFDNNNNPKVLITNKDLMCNLYDYSNLFNVARVVGCDNENDFGFTSFEAENKGNWVYNENAISDQYFVTGKKSFPVSGSNSLTKQNLNSGNTYILSYWTMNSNPFVITGTVSGYPRLLKTKGSWKCFEHKITGSSQVTISGTGIVDELRIYKEGSVMVTYCYEPLIGMTYECDANNNIYSYEYDGFNRVSVIRDQDNNIVKKFCYNYAGVQEDCTSACTFTMPNWQNTATPIRCEQGICENTGYQEQEQKDMNPCSATYNQTQWIQVGYNPTACPASTNKFINSINLAAYAGYVAKFTNNATSVQSTFVIPTSSGPVQIGCLPVGTYKVDIYMPTGTPGILLFTIGGISQSGTSASFNNVTFSTKSLTITIDWDL